VSDSELCQSISHGTTCDFTRHHTHWLLQLNPCRSTCIKTGATATSAKCGHSTGLNLDRWAHISPALQQLHWLPVMHRVTFKIATLMHQILHKRCPSCLGDLVTFNTTYSQRRHLRSSNTRSAAVRRAWTQFGQRAFSVCGPIVWNSLPTALRNIDSYPVFRRALKSHLFSCAFSS